jgi:hypothetical protein
MIMEDRLIELEKRLDSAISTIEKHNFLLENLMINRERHAEEHEFLRELIKEKRLKNQIKERVLTNFLTAGITTVAIATITGLGLVIKDWLSK